MACLGFNISIYPGDSEMRAWKNQTPFRFCCFYLGGFNYVSNPSSWLTKRSYLTNLGYGFLVCYMGRQVGNSNVTKSQGIKDADNAITLAHQAGFPTGTIIYLYVKAGTDQIDLSYLIYIDAWISQINDNTIYRPGVYCNASVADRIYDSLCVFVSLPVSKLTLHYFLMIPFLILL